MQKLRLNGSKTSGSRLPALGLIVIGLVGTAHLLMSRNALVNEVGGLQSRVAHLQRLAQGSRHVSATLPQDSADELAAVDRISQALTFPWESILDALKASAGSDVTIEKIQPENTGGALRVTGRAVSGSAFLAYLSRLEKDGRWQSILPVSEDADNNAKAGAVVFVVTVKWGSRP